MKMLEQIVEEISRRNDDPEWLRKLRLRALKYYYKTKHKDEELSNLNESFFKPLSYKLDKEEIPQEIANIYKRLGIHQEELKAFLGMSIQQDNSLLALNLKKEFIEKGAIITPLEEAVKKHKEVKRYLGRISDYRKNPRNALNLAMFTSGLYINIPKESDFPLPYYAFFTINHENFSQFERSVIVINKRSSFYYVEGCAAPIYRKESFHLGVMEAIIEKKSKAKFLTLQNWSNNVINIPYKHVVVKDKAKLEWIDINIGSKKTIKKPYVYMPGKEAKLQMKSVSLTSENQIHKTGAYIKSVGKKNKSVVLSKSLINGGEGIFDNTFYIAGKKCHAMSECDTFFLKEGVSATKPQLIVKNNTAMASHEAKTSFFDENIAQYLMSKGLNKEDSLKLISIGYIEEELATLPLDIALEFKKIVEIELEGGVG